MENKLIANIQKEIDDDNNNQKCRIIKNIGKFIFLIFGIIIININYTLPKNIKDLKVGLCLIGKHENLYAPELVEYYKNLGYNHIFIYDNNDIGDEKFDDVLYNEINNNFVTIINYRGYKGDNNNNNQQQISYYDCYKRYSSKYDWLSFFDFDEFLYIKNNKTIQEFLSDKKYKKCINMKLNWLMYTDNDLVYYENKPLKERFTSYDANFYRNEHIKSTVRGHLKKNYWRKMHNPHTSILHYTCCNALGEVIGYDAYFNTPPNYDIAYIKHYWGKTIEEYCLKIKRGYPDHKVVFTKELLNDRFKSFFELNKKTKEKLDYIKKTFNITYE